MKQRVRRCVCHCAEWGRTAQVSTLPASAGFWYSTVVTTGWWSTMVTFLAAICGTWWGKGKVETILALRDELFLLV